MKDCASASIVGSPSKARISDVYSLVGEIFVSFSRVSTFRPYPLTRASMNFLCKTPSDLSTIAVFWDFLVSKMKIWEAGPDLSPLGFVELLSRRGDFRLVATYTKRAYIRSPSNLNSNHKF
ncbi:hypothetical protein Fot_22742 [Forsythia ovata]|uniref:Pentatricopeptide repeat-containing protein n=1 Tax=Forsythia ovata TaxID=205694 RepID=A0ABD1UYK4_9LAMI